MSDEFCLYLWRSEGAPGILYLAKGVSSAETVYSGLVNEGYIVKIVHMNTDVEYEMREGALSPVSVRQQPLNTRVAACKPAVSRIG